MEKVQQDSLTAWIAARLEEFDAQVSSLGT